MSMEYENGKETICTDCVNHILIALPTLPAAQLGFMSPILFYQFKIRKSMVLIDQL